MLVKLLDGVMNFAVFDENHFSLCVGGLCFGVCFGVCSGVCSG